MGNITYLCNANSIFVQKIPFTLHLLAESSFLLACSLVVDYIFCNNNNMSRRCLTGFFLVTAQAIVLFRTVGSQLLDNFNFAQNKTESETSNQFGFGVHQMLKCNAGQTLALMKILSQGHWHTAQIYIFWLLPTRRPSKQDYYYFYWRHNLHFLYLFFVLYVSPSELEEIAMKWRRQETNFSISAFYLPIKQHSKNSRDFDIIIVPTCIYICIYACVFIAPLSSDCMNMFESTQCG